MHKQLKAYKKQLGHGERVCMAPFYNLTFSFHGEILPCFYNKQYAWGKYYQGIDYVQLWKNQHFKNLRKSIRKHRFTYGCLECYYHIINGNHNFVYAKRYQTQTQNINRNYPDSLEFQISNQCNFSCVMCNDEYSSSICSKNNVTNTNTGYDDDFPNSLIPLLKHAKRLVFSGGEPFLIKAYDEIIELSLKYGSNQAFFFSTNGSAIREKHFDFIRDNKVGISMSFDSIDEETFNLVTGSKKFATVKENLLRLKTIYEQKAEPLFVKVSPMQQNINTLAETFTFLNDNDLNITFNHVKYPANCSLSELKSEQLKDIVANLKQLDVRNETPVQKENKSRYRNFIYYLENTCEKSETREREQANGFVDYEARFLAQIKEYINAMNIKALGTEKQIFDVMFGHVKNPALRNECIRYFSELPVYWLISELRFRESNSIFVKHRVSQIAEAFQKIKEY